MEVFGEWQEKWYEIASVSFGFKLSPSHTGGPPFTPRTGLLVVKTSDLVLVVGPCTLDPLKNLH